MMSANRPLRFSFVDEGEAVRLLGISRDRLLSLVESGELRAYPGVGKGNFFRTSDLEKLAAEINPPAAPALPTAAPAGAPITMGGLSVATPTRKEHDPAMKVHLRLQADLKWFDLGEDDLAAWVREMHPAAYEKNRGNLTRIVERLEHLRDLIDAAATTWEHNPRGQNDPAPEE